MLAAITASVLVYRSIKVIRIEDVDLNVLLVTTVLEIKLAVEINVWTLVQEHVAKVLSVPSLITSQCVAVQLDTQATPSLFVAS